jgi:hypothetical protein
MNALPPRSRRRRRRRWPLVLLLLVVGAALFVLGVALGRALEENPRPGGPVTAIRTLKPLPLPPARVTDTVTVTAP